jgi:hypothetical protein
VEHDNGIIRLLNPQTGGEYARLEDPCQDRADRLVFAPDGAQLVATNNDRQSIHVWDLRAIRETLAEMGLDWDLPAYQPTDAERQPVPLKIGPEPSLVLGDSLRRSLPSLPRGPGVVRESGSRTPQ